jgi:AP-2 complex subunit alpha
MYRLTVRATDEAVPEILLKVMEDRLAEGVPIDSLADGL